MGKQRYSQKQVIDDLPNWDASDIAGLTKILTSYQDAQKGGRTVALKPERHNVPSTANVTRQVAALVMENEAAQRLNASEAAVNSFQVAIKLLAILMPDADLQATLLKLIGAYGIAYDALNIALETVQRLGLPIQVPDGSAHWLTYRHWFELVTRAATTATTPDDLVALRTAARKELPDLAQAHDDNQARIDQDKAAAAEQARRDSHTTDTTREQWDTERRIVAQVIILRDEGRKQIDAARHYLKLLTDRYNGHGKPLTNEEQAEYFYLSGEKAKGDRLFGKQISEIMNKHGKPGTLTAAS